MQIYEAYVVFCDGNKLNRLNNAEETYNTEETYKNIQIMKQLLLEFERQIYEKLNQEKGIRLFLDNGFEGNDFTFINKKGEHCKVTIEKIS